MQGLFSGVWGAASLVGPAGGGLRHRARFGWRWVFVPILPLGPPRLLPRRDADGRDGATPDSARLPPALAGLPVEPKATARRTLRASFSGTAIYGVTVFVPLFVQGALGGTARLQAPS